MARDWWDVPADEPGHKIFLQRYKLAASVVSGRVFDAACGYGTGTLMLAQHSDEAWGFDLDAQAITKAAQRSHQIENVFFHHVNLEDPEWTAPPCTWFVTLETVEHLRRPDAFLDQVKGLAQEGIVLSTPIIKVSSRPGNYHNFTPDQIDSWFTGWGDKILDERIGEHVRGNWNPAVYKLAAWRKKPA